MARVQAEADAQGVCVHPCGGLLAAIRGSSRVLVGGQAAWLPGGQSVRVAFLEEERDAVVGLDAVVPGVSPGIGTAALAAASRR
jgi:hypothetical protein